MANKSWLNTALPIALIVCTVMWFSYFGYQSATYILSETFNIVTNATIYDLFIGIVAIISSVLLFIGAVYALKKARISIMLILFGSLGALFKNVLDIFNDIQPLYSTEAAEYTVKAAATWIGFDIFNIAIWIFIIAFFTRKSFRDLLIN